MVILASVYVPTQTRIYFLPNAQSAELQWHYINCDTGVAVAYTHGAQWVVVIIGEVFILLLRIEYI